MDMWMELEQEGVDPVLLKEVRAFHDANPPDPAAAGRVPQPRFLYYGKQVWEAAAAALLCGENILLAGPKATGKTCWQRIWPQHSEDLPGMYPSMSM